MEVWEKLGLSEDEYYAIDFDEVDGVVSIWIGLSFEKDDMEKDILREQCGVGYYDIDFNEIFDFRDQFQPVEELIGNLSYSSSFVEEVGKAAKEMGISEGRYIAAQYNFVFAPERANQKILSNSRDPIFIGVFPYFELDSAE